MASCEVAAFSERRSPVGAVATVARDWCRRAAEPEGRDRYSIPAVVGGVLVGVESRRVSVVGDEGVLASGEGC